MKVALLHSSLRPVRLGLSALGALVLALVACSSSPNSSNATSTSACVCEVNNAGQSQDVACGASSCIDGTTFSCSADASLSQGGTCTGSTTVDGGKTSDGPLTCASYAWCGSGEITRWNGQTLPTQRGGTISPGLYRAAYKLAERGTGTEFGDYGSAYLFGDGSFRDLGALGSVGTFTTNGGKLLAQQTASCNNDTGADTATSTRKFERDYLVDASGTLFMFGEETGGPDGSQTIATAYKKVDALCKGLPTAVPNAPGDSYVCEVRNCGCTEASSGPADQSVCKYVHGG